jgi:hypothetical protein
VSRWSQPPDALEWNEYRLRAQEAYWDKSFPACRAAGPQHAECLLDEDHAGDHFGNGYDQWGPQGAIHWDEKRRRT